MPHVKRQKIQLKSQVILTALLLVAGLFVFANTTQAAVGFQVGTSTLILNSGENLMFGNISAASNAASNLLLLQNASLPKFIITSVGNVGIGISNPNDIFSIGNAGTAPAGSSNTGHNYTNTYLSSDNYALANYGVVKTLIASATSSSALWGGTTAAHIWNLNSGNIGIGTSTPVFKLDVVGDVRTGEQTIDSANYLKKSYIVSMNTAGSRRNIVIPFETIDWHRATMKILITSTDGSVSPHGRIEVVYNVIVYNNGGALSFYRNEVQTNEAFGGITDLLYLKDPEISGTNVYIPMVWKITQTRSFKVTLEASGNSNDIPYLRNISIGNEYSNSDSTTVKQTVNFLGNVGIGVTNAVNPLQVQVGAAGRALRVYSVSDYPAISGTTGDLFVGAVQFMGSTLPWSDNSIALGSSARRWSSFYSRQITDNGTNVGIGTTAPNDIFSIGNAGSSAPAGSSNTGHNYTSTYLSSDDYALANYGVVKTLIASATSSSGLWMGVKNGNIWNGDAGAGNVGIGTTTPGVKLDVSGAARFTGLGTGAGERILTVGNSISQMPVLIKAVNSTSLGSNHAIEVQDENNAKRFSLSNTASATYLSTEGGDLFINRFANNVVMGDYANNRAFRFIYSTGRMGLGYGSSSGNPGSMLSVAGNAAIGSSYFTSGAPTNGLAVEGNVGIGTTNPTNQLHIVGNLASYIGVSSGVGIQGNSSGSGLITAVSLSPADPTAGISNGANFGFNGSATNFYGMGLGAVRNGKYDIWNQTGSANGGGYRWYIGTSEKMTINNSGNLGIGTTVPNDIFSIGNAGSSAPAGSSNTGHNYTSTYLSSDDYALANYGVVKTLIASATSSSGLWMGAKNGTIWNGDAGAGNVGVGTTNPIFKLHVIGGIYGNKFTTLNGFSTPTTTSLFINDSSGQLAAGESLAIIRGFNYVNDVNANLLAVGTAGGSGWEKFVIKSSGNVGIGTTNPGAKLDLNIGTSAGDGYRLLFNGSTAGSAWRIKNPNVDNGTEFGTVNYNDLSLITNNTEKLRITVAGNVGIGTTTPLARLNIVGTTGVYPLFVQYHSTTEGIPAMPDYLTSVFIRNINSAYANEVTYIGGSGAWTGLNFGDKDSYNIGSILYYNTDNSLRFGVNASERMRLTSTGNMGLGTISPNDIFSIGNAGSSAPAGSSNTGHNYTSTYLSSDDYALANYGVVKTLIASATSSSGLWMGVKNGNIWNGDAGVGNVGIGTIAPQGQLDVRGGQSTVGTLTLSRSHPTVLGTNFGLGLLRFGGEDIDSSISNWNSALISGEVDSTWSSSSDTPTRLTFYTTPDASSTPIERLRINSSGNIGIGTISPTSLLHVQGDYSGGSDNLIPQMKIVNLATSSSYAFIKVMTGNGYSGGYPEFWMQAGNGSADIRVVSNHNLKFWTNNTVRAVLTTDGNLGIGITNPGAKLHILNATSTPYKALVLDNDSTVDGSGAIIHFVSSTDENVGAQIAGGRESSGGTSYLKFTNYLNGTGFAERMRITGLGNVGIGTTAPNDIFSIGNAGSSAPAGSSNTGHNYTSTYLSSDDYALANYGIVKTLISSATSSLTSLWGGTLGGNIWSLNTTNVGIGTTLPGEKLFVQGNIGLPMSSSTEGMIKLAGYRYLHSFGNTNNTFVGYQAGNTTLTTAVENTFIGAQAGQSLTTGSYNVAIGRGAGASLTSGLMNTLIGRQTGGNITTGSSNTLVGLGAGESWAGSNSVMMGYYAGRWNSTGNNNVIIGVAANSYGNANSETVAVGNSAFNTLVNASNNIALGNYTDFISPGNGTAALTAGTNLSVGVYYYRVTYVLSSGETNSSAFASVTTTAGNQAVNLSSLPIYSGPYNCTARKIYRTPVGVYGRGPYYLIATINDNVTTTYTDTTPDASLATVLVDNANSVIIGNSARAVKGNQIILGSTQNEIYLGKGVYSSSPGTISLLATGGMGTNNAGANLLIAAGPGTGSASGGNITFQTSPAGSSGSLFNTLFDRMTITSTGNIGIGTSVPNDIFSIGNSGSAPSGSSLTGHNFTSTYLDADNYALANVGYVKSLISAATSTIATSSAVTSLFLTTATSTGSLAYTGGYVGYDAGNQICKAAQTGSHFCRTDEIIYLIQVNGAASFAAINSQDAWIADGPPGFTGTVSADDCGGWTDGTNNKLGHFWIYASSGGGRGSLSSCDTIKKISCCK